MAAEAKVGIIQAIAIAKETSVESIGPDLRTEICQMTPNQLRCMWRQLWEDSKEGRRIFCQMLQINGEHFCQWIAGRKATPYIADAVRSWLLQLSDGKSTTEPLRLIGVEPKKKKFATAPASVHEEFINAISAVRNIDASLVQPGDLEGQIDTLSDADIPKMQRLLWHGSVQEFGDCVGVTDQKFICWLLGQIEHPDWAQAVRNWLRQVARGEADTFPVAKHEHSVFTRQSVDFVQKLAAMSQLAIDRRQLSAKLMHHASKGLNAVLFVDADGCAYIVEQYNPRLASNTHVVCVLRAGTLSRPVAVAAAAYPEHVSLVLSSTIAKQAVDLLIAMLATHLDVYLPRHIAFFVFSNDYFAREVCAEVQKTRRCRWIRDETKQHSFANIQHKINLDAANIHTTDCSISSEDMKQIKELIHTRDTPLTISEIGQRIPNRRHLWWEKHLDSPDVLRQLEAAICYVQHHNGTLVPVIYAVPRKPNTV
jgi:hypothetical protein